ncbi:hypothetical protein TSAR_016335 [Trichomalopsis sarcophagae]|uniref:CCHC-type domain-containing protein n=1 Tax=Trichomalopsis sarcophagae TaxID=543379 RepID=A0A232EWK5_9HYME|nr:hypothetical protein TSAR_016335 [Trichomalopsis sarcophagae]
MQRKTIAPRAPHNAPEPPAKVKPNKNKRPEWILVKVEQNATYTEVMGKIRKDVNPDTTGRKVLGVKQTRSGDILLKLGRGSNMTVFTAEVGNAVLGLGQVKKEKRKATLEKRDMDSEATEEEVRAAIGGAFRKPDNVRRVTLLKPNTRGLRMATVILSEKERPRNRSTLCYKCEGDDHRMAQCQMKASCFFCKDDGQKK